MKININENNYIEVWVDLLVTIKLQLHLPKREREVLCSIIRKTYICSKDKKEISKALGTTVQVISNSITRLQKLNLIKKVEIKDSFLKEEDKELLLRKNKKMKYIYLSVLPYPKNITQLLSRKEMLNFVVESESESFDSSNNTESSSTLKVKHKKELVS